MVWNLGIRDRGLGVSFFRLLNWDNPVNLGLEFL